MSSEHIDLKLSGKDNLNELHRLNRIFMHWLPQQIIISQHQNTNAKRNNGQVFISYISIKSHRIKVKELTDHPIGIGAYPEYDSQVMTNFTHELAGSYCNEYSKKQGWKDHSNAQWPPYHAPADIFKQPENNVQVFHFTVT